MLNAHTPAPFTVRHQADDLVVGEVGVTCVSIWRTKPTLASFEIQRAELSRSVRAHPGRANFLCIIQSSSEPPEEAVRRASLAMLAEHQQKLVKVACVIEGDGFRASITRSVLSGMQLVLRAPMPVKFFRHAYDAALWLSSDESTATARMFGRAVESLRSRAPSRPRKVASGE